MNNGLTYGKDARDKMKIGVDTLAKAVVVTLGPKGRNVAIKKDHGKPPTITKDGVTVAKSIKSVKDPYEDIGVQMIKEVAHKTAGQAGDGTTTATLLAHSIITKGMEAMNVEPGQPGYNPVGVKRGIDLAVGIVVESLRKQSQKIGENNDLIKSVATISANNDVAIGKLIAEAMSRVGNDGLITLTESKDSDTHILVEEGLQIDRGYIHQEFITDVAKMQVVLENPYILIYEKKITALLDIKPYLTGVQDRPLLIIAEDVDGEALATMIINKKRNSKKFAAIKAPAFGPTRSDMLKDIAILTGATLVSEEQGFKLANGNMKFLGEAERIVITAEKTLIAGAKGKKTDIEDRKTQVRNQIEACEDKFEKSKLEQRMARLAGGVAVIYVGAPTDPERNEKRDRIDDALQATRAAIEEGILPGGGTAYIRAIQPLQLNIDATAEGDEKVGMNIVLEALVDPLRQILTNAGMHQTQINNIVEEVKFPTFKNYIPSHSESPAYGYNAKTEQFEDLLATGIIDPAKVSRVALENAGSIGGMFLTSECAIIDEQ